MPYPNEHAARLRDPGDFARIVQIWEKASEGIRALGGPLKSAPNGGVVIQSIRFDADKWTVSEAKKWLSDHDYKPIEFEPATKEKTKASASASEPLVITAALSVEASDGESKKGARHFYIDAYTGGPMKVGGWRYPVAINLAGLSIRKGAKVYLEHDPRLRVGHIEAVENKGDSLRVVGVVSSTSAAAREVVADADNGYPWQASVAASVIDHEFVPEGKTVKVNGRELAGPLNVAARSELYEVSFVGSGADPETFAVAASATGESNMAEQKEEVREETTGPVSPEILPHTVKASATTGRSSSKMSTVEAEIRRKQELDDLGAEYIEQHPDDIETIKSIIEAAKADGWNRKDTELALLRLFRSAPPPVARSYPEHKPLEIEAAMCDAAGLPNVETMYPEHVMEQARKRFRHGATLGELLMMAARENGWHGHSLRGNLRDILRAATMPRDGAIQAGFSNIDVGGILSAVANKFLLAGFMSVERTWRNICAVRSVPNFNTITSYRLVGADQYEQVAPGGTLKHGTLGEETYTNKADTYGLMLTVDRRDIINDDLGAISAVPRKLGRGSGLKINDIFWKTFMNNSSFFTAARANYLAGATTALSIDGLTAAEVLFLNMVDAEGKPTGIMPSIMLVPTALAATATQLYKSLEIRDTTSSTKYPVANPHQGKFRVEVSRYLSNSHYAGYSSKAWYLLASPDDLPVIEVAFLDGQEAPTIETAEADFNVLGIQMRGFHDFGVALQDYRGGVKMLGEAE